MRLNGGHVGTRTPNFSVQTRCDTRFHHRPINHQCNSVKIRTAASNVPQHLNNLEAQSNICLLSFSCTYFRKKICSPLTNHHQLWHQMSNVPKQWRCPHPGCKPERRRVFMVLTISQPIFVFVFSGKTYRREVFEKQIRNYACVSKMNPQPFIYQLIRGFALATVLSGQRNVLYALSSRRVRLP